MKPTKLEWEDVIQFEEVEGYGKEVWKHNNQYYIVNIEGGMMDERVIYELPNELFALLECGERTLRELSYRVKNNCWPPTEEEINKIKRGRAKERPKILIANPKNRLLFTQEELKELMPIAEKQWIESEGKLPDDYVSPLK